MTTRAVLTWHVFALACALALLYPALATLGTAVACVVLGVGIPRTRVEPCAVRAARIH